MAQPEDVQAGRIYTCNRNNFSNKNGSQDVVVVVAEYSESRRNPRALIAVAEVKGSGRSVNIKINLDELHTVPIEKLVAKNPVDHSKEIERWKAELRNRIDKD